MTPEERDRLAKLEVKVAGITGELASISSKLDQLIAAANMGKGAWWAVLRLGGLLVVAGSACGWVIGHWNVLR